MEGGQRQDGGAWGRTEEEDSRQIFLPSHNKLSKCPCVPWVGSWQAVPVFGWGEEEGFVVERESFVTKIVYIVDSVVVVFLSVVLDTVQTAKVLAR